MATVQTQLPPQTDDLNNKSSLASDSPISASSSNASLSPPESLKNSNAGWWHRASREDCIRAEENMITSFVDLKRISYATRDVIIPFDSRPIRVQNQKSFLSSWLSSSSSSATGPDPSATETIHSVTFQLIALPPHPSESSANNANNYNNASTASTASTANSAETEEKKQSLENLKNPNDDKALHIVMGHGYGCGLGIFIPAINCIFDELISRFGSDWVCKKVFLHCIDWLGCGLSSKPKYQCETTEEAESFFIESLEMWRAQMNIPRMVLAGHSIGGYCSVRYSLKYAPRVRQLVLISPAGVAKKPDNFNDRSRYKWQFRVLFGVVENGLTPADVIRMAGPKARSLVLGLVEKRYARAPNVHGDYQQKLTPTLGEYLYQITHGNGSGEYCLNKILTIGAYAQKPLYEPIQRLQKGTSDIKMDFMYGELDWMDRSAPDTLKLEGKLKCQVYQINNAGHQIAVENRQMFAQTLAKVVEEGVAQGR